MNIYKLIEYVEELEREYPQDSLEEDDVSALGLIHKHLKILLEITRLADLVNAEFQSDPTSVQCFDLNVIVYSLNIALQKLEAI